MDFASLDQLRSFFESGAIQFPAQRSAQYLLDSYQRRLSRDTYVQRWMNAIETTPNLRSVHPWQAIGEQRTQAMLIAGGGYRELPQIGELSEIQTRAFIATRILLAAPYLWSNAMVEVARSAPLPAHVISRTVMHRPFMFWAMETAFPIYTPEDAQDGEYETNWVAHIDEGIAISSYRDYLRESAVPGRFGGDREPTGIMGGSILYGKRFPDDLSPVERESVGMNLRMMAFLNSPYTTVETHYPPRSIRRDAARSDSVPISEGGIQVVKLRERMSRNSAEDGQRDVEWEHQWWVSAHYRAQWYPSEQAHHVIWIGPYLKGPSDKPMLQRETAYVVNR